MVIYSHKNFVIVLLVTLFTKTFFSGTMVTFITIFNLSGKLGINFPQVNMSVSLEHLLAKIKRNVPLVRKMPKKKK